MPDSDVARTTAVVPSCSGAGAPFIFTVISAWLSSVRPILVIDPTRRPPTWTSSPFTSWPALRKSILYVWDVPAPIRSSATITAMAIASAPTASPRATVIPPSPPRSAASYLGIVNSARSPLLHAQGTLGLTGEELADERVLGVEELLGGAGLDDPALPQDRDVLGHA